jgi:hypothetical protein
MSGMLRLFLATLAVFLVGCATESPGTQRANEEDSLIIVSKSTGQVNFNIQVDEPPKQAAYQRIRVEQSLSPRMLKEIRVELSDLPLKIPVRPTGKPDEWQAEIDPNVLELLAKASRTATYTGTLTLDGPSEKKIPLNIIIEPMPKSPSRTIHSAG